MRVTFPQVFRQAYGFFSCLQPFFNLTMKHCVCPNYLVIKARTNTTSLLTLEQKSILYENDEETKKKKKKERKEWWWMIYWLIFKVSHLTPFRHRDLKKHCYPLHRCHPHPLLRWWWICLYLLRCVLYINFFTFLIIILRLLHTIWIV